MRVALAQINPTIGDLKGNAKRIIHYIQKAHQQRADLVVFPELALQGYPPKDLLYQKNFVQKSFSYYQHIVAETKKKCDAISVVLGSVAEHHVGELSILANSAFFFQSGKTLKVIHKKLLPNYDVFDEKRYFQSPTDLLPNSERQDNIEDNIINVNNKNKSSLKCAKFFISICEDLWDGACQLHPQQVRYTYQFADSFRKNKEMLKQIDGIINLSASPFHIHKTSERYSLVANLFQTLNKPLYYVNQVGANDELIFDGGSFFAKTLVPTTQKKASKQLYTLAAKSFCEELMIIDDDFKAHNKQEEIIFLPQKKIDKALCGLNSQQVANLTDALTLGIKDYFQKLGFQKAIVGLSGGIDSAVVAALAVRALGKANVSGFAMPSRYSSKHSLEDAKKLAINLGISLQIISIEPMFKTYLKMLKTNFANKPTDITEENLQSRIRGTTLMAISNKHGNLLLNTGNKSELAVGYATLYGDMNGAISVLGDVYKINVYNIAHHLNSESVQAGRGVIIPKSTVIKEPSAELQKNQKDTDALPPYKVLDEILHAYIENHLISDEITKQKGYSKKLVAHIIAQVDANEYKRKQAPPVLKTSPKSFGSGRRMPIVAKANKN